MDVATDVNIAVTRVYVERFISGRRDWGILNIWTYTQNGSSTWQNLAYIANFIKPSIGPKD